MITFPRHARIKAVFRSDPGGTPIDRRCAIGLVGLGVIVLFLVAC